MPKKGCSRVMVAVRALRDDRLVRVDFTGRFQWTDTPPWWGDWAYVEPDGQVGVRIYLPLDFKVEPLAD